jgi:Neuraminidase (sialidase)
VLHVAYWVRLWPLPATGTPDPVRPVYHVSSSDHGKTWSARSVIDPGNQHHEHPPVLVSDPRTNALYVAWAGNADPMNEAPGFNGDMEIFFRSSTDGGKTWTRRLLLNDDPKGKANQIDPGISVAPNGRIDVAWYDGRLSTLPVTGDTENGFNDVYATSSTDGGLTFSPNLRVSDRSADRSIGVWSNNVDQRLNVGITSSNDAMYVAWQDTRNANKDLQPEDVYMASVRLDRAYITPLKSARSVPTWLAMAAGLALGLGIAFVAIPRITPRPGAKAGVTA